MIEADLLRFYHVDVLDVGKPRLSIERTLSLIDQLPTESATVRKLRGEFAEWGHAEALLAVIADLLQGANWQRAGDRKLRKPDPVWRPESPQVHAQRVERLEAFQALMRRRKEVGDG